MLTEKAAHHHKILKNRRIGAKLYIYKRMKLSLKAQDLP